MYFKFPHRRGNTIGMCANVVFEGSNGNNFEDALIFKRKASDKIVGITIWNIMGG